MIYCLTIYHTRPINTNFTYTSNCSKSTRESHRAARNRIAHRHDEQRKPQHDRRREPERWSPPGGASVDRFDRTCCELYRFLRLEREDSQQRERRLAQPIDDVQPQCNGTGNTNPAAAGGDHRRDTSERVWIEPG